MSKLSPKEKFARFLKAYLLVFVLAVCGVVFAISYSSPHNERKSVEVTLVNAYSSMQKCGSKGHYTCEVFTGRFRTAEGVYYDREMDGFFYHRYVDQGRRNIEGASITLSDYDQGFNPSYVGWLRFGGGILALMMLFGFMLLPLCEYDILEAQRKWEREQEEKERKERYGY